MKSISTPVDYHGRRFSFNRTLGCLTWRKASDDGQPAEPRFANEEKRRCWEAVQDPFLMRRRGHSDSWRHIRHERVARLYARWLTWLCKHCYPAAQLLGHLRLGLFADAGDACQFYKSLYPDPKRQRVLCLPRALFAATTSRRFQAHGVLFIGAFLPTVRMHAWVVEDGMTADRRDGQWIHYRPVMIML